MTTGMDDGGTIIGAQIADIGAWIGASVDIPIDELLGEGLAIVARTTGADRVVLLAVDGHTAAPIAVHPVDLRSVTDLVACPVDWIPWGLGGVRAEQFIFAPAAGALPASPDGTTRLSDLGVCSAAHLPVTEHGVLIGSLALWWSAAVAGWDDAVGPVLRNLARLLLSRAAAARHLSGSD